MLSFDVVESAPFVNGDVESAPFVNGDVESALLVISTSSEGTMLNVLIEAPIHRIIKVIRVSTVGTKLIILLLFTCLNLIINT